MVTEGGVYLGGSWYLNTFLMSSILVSLYWHLVIGFEYSYVVYI